MFRANGRSATRKPLVLLALAGLVGGGFAAVDQHKRQAPESLAMPGHDHNLTPRSAVPDGIGLQQQLLERWGPYVERTYKITAATWRASMARTMHGATQAQVSNALLESDFDAMMRTLDTVTHEPLAERMPVAAAADSDPIQVSDLSYNVVAPCRVLDTRNYGGRLESFSSVDVQLTGSEFIAQGGATHDCGVPLDAQAVVVNVTAIAPAGPGFLTAYPTGTARPTSSSLNYQSGDVRANEVLVPLSEEATPRLTLYTHDDVDVVVDVAGFFAARPQEAMTCTRVTEYSSLPPGNYGGGFAECPQGQYGERWTQRMGGECAWLTDTPGQPEPGVLHPQVHSWNWMMCYGENQSAVTRQFAVTALCCSVQPSP